MDALLDYMLNHHDKLLFVIAAISLLVELTLIGLSGPLLFFSIGCAITGVLVSFNIIDTLEIEILCVGIFSLLTAFILWRPLKRFQGSVKVNDDSSDLIGQSVIVSETITDSAGSVRYSGINWTARLDPHALLLEIEVGKKVTITGVDGNIIIVNTLKNES